ncbi:MAG: tetratricopeptide repeat protein [Candidatus Aminicenantes bacterium]|nr:tetratricopeptide repeat protein [Candidatus Aminicenantes bacterium]
MKKTSFLLVNILVMALVLVSADFAAQRSQSADVLLGAALHQEEVEGDYEAAIETYKKLLAEYPNNRPLAAQAQLRIGLCYEKLGLVEAEKAYELVLQKYADQPKQVAVAQARLAAMRTEEPEGLTVTKIEGQGVRGIQAVSPDGTKIAVLDINGGQNIAVYDLVTKRLELVTHNDWSRVTDNAIWSPDGKKIAYLQIGSGILPEEKDGKSTDYFLMVSTLDGKTRPIFSTEDGVPVPFDWLPDGSAVAVTLVNAPRMEEVEGVSLGLVPATGGAFKTLHDLEGDFHLIPSGNSGIAYADASPDGRHIVFADGPKGDEQNIYCIGTDGQSLQVLIDHTANDIQPRWSPDGKYVVFLSFRSGNKALWGVSVKNGKPAGEPFIIQEMGPGTTLFNWTAQGLTYRNSVDMWDVYLSPVDPETGEPAGRMEQLDYSPPGRNRRAVWSPDGKHIAFLSAERGGQPGQGYIVIMAAEGGQAREYLIPTDNFWLLSIGGIRWMPDSSGLGYFGKGKKGATLFRFTQASEKWETWEIQTPPVTFEWSPSGNAFLYSKVILGIIEHDLETGEERSIWRPENEKNVFSIPRELRFSRDYKKLVFHRMDAKFENNKTELVSENIVVVDISSGQARTIDSEDFSNLSWTAAWSSDGQNLAVLNHVEGKPSEMFIVPSQGGTPNKVKLSGGPVKGRRIITDWSPDGKHIAFEIRRTSYEIFMMKNIIPKKQR